MQMCVFSLSDCSPSAIEREDTMTTHENGIYFFRLLLISLWFVAYEAGIKQQRGAACRDSRRQQLMLAASPLCPHDGAGVVRTWYVRVCVCVCVLAKLAMSMALWRVAL